jgi:poly-gamma-glutamate synthesis protein (capsule biosynthesis protein)
VAVALATSALVAASVPTSAERPRPTAARTAVVVPSLGGSAVAAARAVRLTKPPRTFTVAAVGDFLSEGHLNTLAAALAGPGVRYDYEPMLRPVESLIRGADLAICHMETPIGAPGATVGFIGTSATGTHLLAAAYEAPFDLRRVGFDRCSTASNHAYDLGLDGIRTTLVALDAAKLGHSGTARTTAEASVQIFSVNGVRVAHLAYARNSNVGFPFDTWRLNRAIQPDQVIRDVATARRLGAEVVIVSIHVYMEMQTGPIAEDRGVVNAITSAAAKPDLVIMHGPHVPQPMETVNGVTTFWSLGNFISAMGVAGRGKYSDPRTLDGLMANVRFTERSNHTWAVQAAPVLLCNVLPGRQLYPGISALRAGGLSATLRTQLQACVSRVSAVVRGLT